MLYYSPNSAVTTPPTRFVTYVGDGHGHFTASAATVEPQSVQWCGAGDLNGDTRPDLVCDNYVLLRMATAPSARELPLLKGTWERPSPVSSLPTSIATASSTSWLRPFSSAMGVVG